MAAQLTISGPERAPVQVMDCPSLPTQATTFHAQPGQAVILDKRTTVYTARDTARA